MHIGVQILVGRWDLPFSVLAEQHHFGDLGLPFALSPLSVLLSSLSTQLYVLVFLGATSLIVRI